MDRSRYALDVFYDNSWMLVYRISKTESMVMVSDNPREWTSWNVPGYPMGPGNAPVTELFMLLYRVPAP